MIVYVLTHEYEDKSGFSVCGVTGNIIVARAWNNANDNCHSYQCETEYAPVNWQKKIERMSSE